MPAKPVSDKPLRNQSPDEMEFDEFVKWATSHIIFGIGEGTKLKSLVYIICNQAALNKIFGGMKPKHVKV